MTTLTINNHKPAIINDAWQLAKHFDANTSYPVASEFDTDEEKHVILNFHVWKKIDASLKAEFKGVYLNFDDELDVAPNELEHLDIIAIIIAEEEPEKYETLVKTLRKALGYKGEIRAIGVDKELTMAALKSGFDSVEVSLAA